MAEEKSFRANQKFPLSFLDDPVISEEGRERWMNGMEEANKVGIKCVIKRTRNHDSDVNE